MCTQQRALDCQIAEYCALDMGCEGIVDFRERLRSALYLGRKLKRDTVKRRTDYVAFAFRQAIKDGVGNASLSNALERMQSSADGANESLCEQR